MKKAKPSQVHIGVAVYRPEQWARLLATAEDADKLESTWEGWHEILEESERNMRAIGIEPVEVLLDLDEFDEYCRKNNLKNTGGARAEYVAHKLAEASGGNSTAQR